MFLDSVYCLNVILPTKWSRGVSLEEFLRNQLTLQCHEAIRGVLVSVLLSVL